jgi:hypothetical protein
MPVRTGEKTPGWLSRSPACVAIADQDALAGRFIWQLVGVLDT